MFHLTAELYGCQGRSLKHWRLLVLADRSTNGVFGVENGRLSDRYRIGTDTGCIVSNRIGYFCIGENPILRASLQVRQLLTGHITQEDQRAFAPRHPLRECRLIVRDTGGSWRGRRRKETVTLHQPASDTKTAGAVLGLGHQRQMTPHPLH